MSHIPKKSVCYWSNKWSEMDPLFAIFSPNMPQLSQRCCLLAALRFIFITLRGPGPEGAIR
jgi:hypothetical protein